MMTKKITFYLGICLISFVVISCKNNTKGSDEEPQKTDEFSRKKMLTNWSENIIVPAYQYFAEKVNNMSKKTSNFIENPTTNKLNELRNAWEDAYINYQKVALFNVGKAKAINLAGFLNVYPVATKITKPESSYTIDKNIERDSYDLSLSSEITRQGFGALDYMLNGLATTDTEILQFYTTNAIAENYKKYLQALVARIKILTDEVVFDWNDNFKTSFIEGDDNSGSSSTNVFSNSFVKYFEVNLREAKIATPSGVRSFVDKDVKRIEAYYKKDISKKLFIVALEAVQNFYNGKSFDGNKTGVSFKQYLEYLDKKELVEEIDRAFTEAISQGNELDDSFISQIETNNSQMITAFEKLQNCVKLLKTDMLSALNIQITYQDADGD